MLVVCRICLVGIRTPANPFALRSLPEPIGYQQEQAIDNTYEIHHSHCRRLNSRVKCLFYIYAAAGGTAYSFLDSMATALMVILEQLPASEPRQEEQCVYLWHHKKPCVLLRHHTGVQCVRLKEGS